MEAIIFLSILIGVCVIAYLLGLRDEKLLERRLIAKLTKDFGQAPNREYKADDLDHLQGYYLKHRDGFQIDDATWNDLNMDGVFARMNYCLSAAGEEYLYYTLRTPAQTDDYSDLEKKVRFFAENHEKRRRMQVLFAKIGRRIRYSIYDYLDYLDNVEDFSNRQHFLMIGLMLIAIVGCFFNFTIGFTAFVLLVMTNIMLYFKSKGKIEQYLTSYGYIMRVILSVNSFSRIDDPAISDDIRALNEAADDFKAFIRGSYILMSPTRMNSGNPVEAMIDFLRMSTHIDIIKFNQMYVQIMDHKDSFDKILTITGRLETYISIACYRESIKDSYCLPTFEGKDYVAKGLYHPLIENAVANDLNADRGILITGSNASGKSTFLKTCALNALLAQSIHTVLAKEYKAPQYRIYSSMALKDDIFEGDSYYIVEIKSIKRILDAASEEGNPVLCFVDEVLRGTNTVERIAASTEILKNFAGKNIMCLAATHDIELTILLKDYFGIYHFEGEITDNDVHFDYLIKKGPATTRNAIKLLNVLGYDENIVDNAQSLAERFLATGQWA